MSLRGCGTRWPGSYLPGVRTCFSIPLSWLCKWCSRSCASGGWGWVLYKWWVLCKWWVRLGPVQVVDGAGSCASGGWGWVLCKWWVGLGPVQVVGGAGSLFSPSSHSSSSSSSPPLPPHPPPPPRYAFAVEECNERERAEKILQHVLDLNRDTPFAYHAMCKPHP